jgi:hypothetical protein
MIYFFLAPALRVNNVPAVSFTWHSFYHSVNQWITLICFPKYITRYFTFLYLILVPCAVCTGTRLWWVYSNICCCSAYVISGVSVPSSWLTVIWKFYTQMCSYTQVTLKSNISEKCNKQQTLPNNNRWCKLYFHFICTGLPNQQRSLRNNFFLEYSSLLHLKYIWLLESLHYRQQLLTLSLLI